MGENNKNENVHVERQDNTYLRRPILQKKFQKALPAKQIESYLKVFGVPEQPQLNADTRTSEQKTMAKKKGDLELYKQKEEEQKQLNRQLALGLGTTAAVIGSQFTPAAPWVNAALAANSGVNLAVQHQEGTLGFNGETILNTLGLAPFGIKTGTQVGKKVQETMIPRIIEYTKNLQNRYTAPKTNLKVKPFKGDNLALVRERLANGGFDKLGIGPDDYISIPTNHPLAPLGELVNSAPVDGNVVNTNKYAFVSDFMNTTPAHVRINAREFLKQLKAVLDPTDDYIRDGNAVYNIQEKLMKSPMFGKYFKEDQKFKNSITAHEFWHAVDDVLNNINKKPLPLGKSIFDKLLKPESIQVPGMDFSTIPVRVQRYFKSHDGTELKARLTQLKNYFGIRDPHQPITVDQWNYARRHYVNDMGADNNMQQLFRAVIDPKAFLDWINPKVASTVGLTSIGTQGLISNNE